ncbi:MAG: hypothetical protein GQ570_03740 [Helicobacteraceae bacterium]|nr:hypothetical protein [Helicobacteraceae bacterium]
MASPLKNERAIDKLMGMVRNMSKRLVQLEESDTLKTNQIENLIFKQKELILQHNAHTTHIEEVDKMIRDNFSGVATETIKQILEAGLVAEEVRDEVSPEDTEGRLLISKLQQHRM